MPDPTWEASGIFQEKKRGRKAKRTGRGGIGEREGSPWRSTFRTL